MNTKSDVIDGHGSKVPYLVALLGFAVVALCVWPLIADWEVSDPNAVWLVAAIGTGITVGGISSALGGKRFGLIACVLIWGGAGQLWMTEPLWFPKIRSKLDEPMDMLAMALIGLQAFVTVYVAWKGDLVRQFTAVIKRFGVLSLAVLFTVSVLISLSPMGFAADARWLSYGVRLLLNAALIAVDSLTIMVLLLLPAPSLARRLPVIQLAAIFAFLGSALFAYYGFDRLPHVDDEAVYTFQAKLYAEGQLVAPAPPEALGAAFEYYLMDVRDGNWIATPPPGWPAILAIGIVLGVPWLVNPALAGLSVLAAASLATRIWGSSIARWAACFLALSPWFLAMGGSLMPHMSSLLLLLLSWNLLLWARKSGLVWLALLAGLTMGWVFVIRQLEGVILGVLTGLWLLSYVRETKGFLRGALYTVGCVLTGSVYFLYNYAITGNPLSAPLARYINDLWGPGANNYGFGENIGKPEVWAGLDLELGHSPYEAIMNTAQNLAILDMDLFGWGVGSLFLVWIAMIFGRLDRAALSMIGLCLVIMLAMFFYWFSGSFYVGPRYWFMMIFPLAVISAHGVMTLTHRLSFQDMSEQRVAATVLVLLTFSVAVYSPWRAVEKYHGYANATDAVRSAGIEGNSLVFVDIADYGSALYLNDPFLRDGRPVYIRDLGPDANAA
ncbi:MAG: hypothetical protein HKO04_00825, partial [Silicimonas sp.]|nr:hypothetical protein [Silicimonas sp.]